MPDATKDTPDMKLVREFARDGSETAFGEIVRRHLNLVHSVALRCVGNEGDAQDVTQAVFIVLARKAGGLSAKTVLPGWLYETTRHTAARLQRTNFRRHAREQEAYMQSTLNDGDSVRDWAQLAPHLEAAMSGLSESDRALLVLRFYQNQTGAQAATQLRIREDAAHKRTARALEKLQKFFSQHGVTLSGTAIATAVSANSVQAAPAGLAAIISSAIPSAMPASALHVFLKSILGKAVMASGSIAILLLGAAFYFRSHAAGETGAMRPNSVQSGRANNPAHASNLISAAGTGTGILAQAQAEKVDLDEAVVHLRVVLHTPPETHSIYDYAGITNAIDAFGLRRRAALDVLLENVNDPEEFVRAGAITGIGHLGRHLPEVPPILWNLVYTSSARERWYSFRALHEAGFDSSDLPALTGLLTNEPVCDGTILNKLVPDAIAEVMTKNPRAAAGHLPALENLLSDDNTNAPFRAAFALIKVEGTNNPQVLPVLHGVFNRPNNRQSEYYKQLALAFLGDCGPTAQPMVPDILAFAKSAADAGVQDIAYATIAKIQPAFSLENSEVAKALKEQQDNAFWAEKWKSGALSLEEMQAALKNPIQAYIACQHLAEMGPQARAAVPDMIHALWGEHEDTRNQMVEYIHKVDPQAVVTEIKTSDFMTGSLHDYLAKQPDTDVNKRLKQDVASLDIFWGWVLPDEFTAFTNNLATQSPGAYEVFAKTYKPTEN